MSKMRCKYNDGVSPMPWDYSTKSHIYQRFYNEVNELLASSDEQFRSINLRDFYVRHEYHDDITKYLNPEGLRNQLIILEGVAGSGKSTIQRNVFDYTANAIVYRGNTIVIPYSYIAFEGDQNALTMRMAQYLNAARCNLSERFSIPPIDNEFADFLKYVREREEALTQASGVQATSFLEMFNENPLEVSILAFQFTVSHSKCKINNVIFIFEDMEAIGERYEDIPVRNAVHLYTSLMRKRKEGDFNKWKFVVIISMRHYLWRILNGKMDFDRNSSIGRVAFESINPKHFDIQSVPIRDIVAKRQEVLLDRLLPYFENETKTEFLATCTVISKVVDLIGDLALALAIGNCRDALKYIRHAVFNLRWIQRDSDESVGAFRISESDYVLNKSSLLRAIGMAENTAYRADRIIPNLLKNNKDGGDIWTILALMFFVNKWKEGSWDAPLRVKEDYLDVIKPLGSAEFQNGMKNAALYLLKKRLLLRGKNCIQQDAMDDPTGEESDFEKFPELYPSKAAKLLWDELEDNSTLFEMFVDDVYWSYQTIPFSIYRKEESRHFGSSSFLHCLSYLEHLVAEERKLCVHAHNIGEDFTYLGAFGDDLATEQLFKGLSNSYQRHYQRDINETRQQEIKDKMKGIQNAIADCKSVLEHD